jgi:hypothetical protein
MKSDNSLSLILILLILGSCHSRSLDFTNMPKEVKSALGKSGANAAELLTVIAHYTKSPKDSLKLRAACFLIANMDQWHYYKGKLLDDYLGYLINIRTKEGFTQRLHQDILDSIYGPFSYAKLDLRYDIQEITAKQLIDNIDLAFKVWQEQPWGKRYSFAQFCEYILPLKMGDEMPNYIREGIFTRYNLFLSPLDKNKLDAVTACTVINDELKKKGWYILLGTGFLPHIPASKLIDKQVGSCRDQSDLGAYIMRSLGIPVTLDFIPQWPTRSLGHDFNAVIGSNGKAIMFGTADENPGFCRFMQVPKGKIYRHIVEKNDQSLAELKDDQEIVPEFMNSPYFKDVTDEYVNCSDISVPLLKNRLISQYKHAYICLFNNKTWIPVHWGNVRNDTVVFTKMEGQILYLAAYYDVNGITPANYPFILTKEGKLKFLIPDNRHRITSIKFTRVFSILPHFLTQLDGDFQGSNAPDFQNLTELFSTSKDKELQQFWNCKTISTKDSFRYVRYYRSRQCIIGEMEFYSEGKKLVGKVFSSGPDMGEADHFIKEKAVDGDVGTSFISLGNDPAWVGLDFGHMEKIDSIRFSPGISVFGPRCYIIPGHKYELRCWDRGQWLALDSCIAGNADVAFQDIPSNALYLLHDLTKNVNERCFTIENGRQIWW